MYWLDKLNIKLEEENKMKKSLFTRVLLSLIIVSMFIAPSVFASEVKKDADITPRAPAQRVIDYKSTVQRSGYSGIWTNVSTKTYYKYLYPPVGYQYKFEYHSPTYTREYDSGEPGVKERIRTLKYYYKLVRL